MKTFEVSYCFFKEIVLDFKWQKSGFSKNFPLSKIIIPIDYLHFLLFLINVTITITFTSKVSAQIQRKKYAFNNMSEPNASITLKLGGEVH